MVHCTLNLQSTALSRKPICLKNSSIKLILPIFSANCFTDKEVSTLAKSISSSKSLKEIKLNNNRFSPKGITDLVEGLNVENIVHSKLITLDLNNHNATKNITHILESLKAKKPNLEVKLGGILENFEIIGPDIKLLFLKTANYESMHTKIKKNRKDFGHFVLSLQDSIISIGLKIKYILLYI